MKPRITMITLGVDANSMERAQSGNGVSNVLNNADRSLNRKETLNYGIETNIDHGGSAGECAGGEGVEALDDAGKYYEMERGVG